MKCSKSTWFNIIIKSIKTFLSAPCRLLSNILASPVLWTPSLSHHCPINSTKSCRIFHGRYCTYNWIKSTRLHPNLLKFHWNSNAFKLISMLTVWFNKKNDAFLKWTQTPILTWIQLIRNPLYFDVNLILWRDYQRFLRDSCYFVAGLFFFCFSPLIHRFIWKKSDGAFNAS